MSSYVLSAKKINKLTASLCYAEEHGGPDRPFPKYHGRIFSPATLGERLYKMNLAAATYRYPNPPFDMIPGEVDDEGKHIPYEYASKLPCAGVVEFYKLLGTFLYQCCEGSTPEAPLYKSLDKYKGELAQAYIERSKEYRAA